ncbi:hypothetical protein [Corallococcus exercitus]|uniref:DUF676 domain-containing protein n=1 Tax=Corallococcus exercitus TaxID=2316736 RepID=A0A7Y4JRH5_9BACT|nr:hypothetical protein [Corallococcus exercitus]NOK09644.1 hypothetical protein [Corallococcus exercitus]
MNPIERGQALFKSIATQNTAALNKAQSKLGTAASTGQKEMANKGRQLGQTMDAFVRSTANKARPVLQPFGLGNQPDLKYDGYLIGSHGQPFPPSIPLKDIPGVLPRGNPNPSGTVIFINGVRNDVGGQFRTLEALADTTKSKAVGVHNATRGAVPDSVQTLSDISGKEGNRAVSTLSNLVYKELQAGRPVHLLAHSQGALVTSLALSKLALQLAKEDKLSPAQVEKKLSQVSVETFGGVAKSYPIGPRYVHYVNDADVLATGLGLGKDSRSDPSKGVVVHHFREGSEGDVTFESTHAIVDVYLKHRVPFSAAREGRFK